MIIPEGFGQMTFEFSGLGLPLGGACTLGFENTLDASAQACATAIAGIVLGADIMNNVSDDVTLASVHVKLGPQATGPSADAPIADTGDDTDNAASPQVAFLIRKTTNAGGRMGRGRMYWPGPAQGSIDEGGLVGAATLAAFQPKWDDFLADLSTGNLPAYLLHSGPGVPNEITVLTIDSRVATQRRRLRR